MFEESASAIPSSIWPSMNSWFTPTLLFLLLNLMIATIAFISSLSNRNHPPNDSNPQKIARSPSVLQRLKSINFYAQYRSQESQLQDYSSLRHNPTSHSDNLTNLRTQSPPDTQSHFFFQENSQENVQSVSQTQSHYLFEQTHEQNPQESQTRFVFEQTHEQNPQESQTRFVFEQTHEQNPQESQTQFVFEEKDSNFDDFKQAHQEQDEEESEMQGMDEVYCQLTGSHVNRTKSDTEPASGEVPIKLPARMRKSASVKSAFGHFQEEEVVEAKRPATVRERVRDKPAEGDEEVDSKADDFINRFKQQLKLQRLESIIRYKDMIGRGSGGRS